MPDSTDAVSNNRRLASELQETLARYEAILASTLDPIVTIDAYGIIQAASNSVERVFGWNPMELIGRNVSVLMPEPYRTYHDEYLTEYRRTGVTNILGRPRHFQAMRKDGTTISVELSVSRVDVPGKDMPLFTGIIRDITRQKEAEQQLQRHREHLEELIAERTEELEASHEQLRLADRLATIGTLAAGLGHDMNNILLPVRCRIDALDAGRLSPEAREHFEEVRKCLQYLQQLADGMHLLSLDPEDAEATTEATSLARWWEHVGALLSRGVPKHVKLSTEIAADLPAVSIPPHRLTQAMLNLVVNAGEAVGEDGQVRVWAESLGDGRVVRLGVTDNGPGMSPDVKRRALDPFFTTKKRGLGTGLGLSLVHGVVRSVGGSVRIDSAPGEGTTIVLTMPAHTAIHPGHAAPPRAVRATVTVSDERVASLVANLLGAAGVFVRDEGLESVDLWITDDRSGTPDRAAAFLESPGRQLMLLGGDRSAWEEIPVIVVDDPTDFEMLRERIHEAVSMVRGPGARDGVRR